MAPVARTAAEFFGGARRDQRPGLLALMSSLVISWLFAKSITNAANLGLAFGLVGGVAYAAYYLSFAIAGKVIHSMRTKGGFRSIHHFLSSRFGIGAMVVFSVLICFRLFNEVWSNTMVIGSYFGAAGELPYYGAIVVFTVLTLAYSLKGGMSSSILTDVIQMVLFGVLITFILASILPETDYEIAPIISSGTWSWAMGGNLLLVAILQSFSYPFHDPVLTDRGFLSDPTTTLKAFLWATPLGFLCILLFSIVGVYGGMVGVEGQAPVEVAKYLGGPLLLVMNFIMITSAASTLDSTFTSFSKLAVVDLIHFTHPMNFSRLRQQKDAADEKMGFAPAQKSSRSSDVSFGLTQSDECSSDVSAPGGQDEYLSDVSERDSEYFDLQLHDTYYVFGKVQLGRLAMILITVLGTIPVFLGPEILSATTVSGAMVMGLGPVFCLWWVKAPPLSFYLSVGFGVLCGILLVLGWWPESWWLTTGKYADLLSVTLVEFAGCLGLYFLGVAISGDAKTTDHG